MVQAHQHPATSWERCGGSHANEAEEVDGGTLATWLGANGSRHTPFQKWLLSGEFGRVSIIYHILSYRIYLNVLGGSGLGPSFSRSGRCGRSRRSLSGCPTCNVRVQRSFGCNHMTCTQCRTHFCYRCGTRLDSESPYGHFRSGGCPTFDTAEVQRMAQREQQGQGYVEDELRRLQEEFGDQRELFAQFQRGRVQLRGAGGRGNVAARLRMGNVQCPTCGQWNGRVGGLNHIRCGMCRSSYCGHCRRRIQGVIAHHFRGEQSCPQHWQ